MIFTGQKAGNMYQVQLPESGLFMFIPAAMLRQMGEKVPSAAKLKQLATAGRK